MSDAPIFDESPDLEPDSQSPVPSPARRSESPAPEGYVSREAKSRYGLTVAVVLGAVVFLQMVLPNAYFNMRFPGMMFGSFELPVADVERCATWEGRLWFSEETFSNQPRRGAAFASRLESVSLKTGQRSEPGIEIMMRKPRLLPAEDRLWLVTADVVGSVEGRRVRTAVPSRQPTGIFHPFLYRGTPAVVEVGEEGAHLLRFTKGDWQEQAALHLPDEQAAPPNRAFPNQGLVPPASPSVRNVRAVTVGETPYFFAETAGTLYVHAGVPAEPEEGDVDDVAGWEKVGGAGNRGWQVLALDGEPVVVTGSGRKPLLRLQALRRQRDGQWQAFFESEEMAVDEWGVCALEQPGRFAIAAQLIPGMTRIFQVEQGRVVDTLRLGWVYEFLKSDLLSMIVFYYVLVLVPPILAIAVISWMMHRCRTSQYTAAAGSVSLASLPRRSIARIIDTLLRSLPSFLVLFLIPGVDVDRWITQAVAQPWGTAATLGIWTGVGCGWSLLLALAFCITEGRWGLTPGKWLAGIRVVKTDLTVCGFWRALVRNLLMIVDGFSAYLVGIGMIAFLGNRQRLGDLAAKTIVIRGTTGNLATGGTAT